MRRRRIAWLLFPVLLAGPAELSRARAAQAAGLEACERAREAHPESLDGYECYWTAARQGADWPQAARRLRAILAEEPENHAARFYLGWIAADRFLPEAEALLVSAAQGFVESGPLRGEVLARLSLARFLRYRGRYEEADAELSVAVRRSADADDPALALQVKLDRAWTAYFGADYSSADRLYDEIRGALPADAPRQLRYQLLRGLGATAEAQGRLREALGHFRAAAELHREAGNLYAEAAERQRMARIAEELRGRGELTSAEAGAMIGEALAVALRGGNAAAEALVRLVLARDADLALDERISHARAALELERRVRDTEDTCRALRQLARLIRERAPDRSEEARRIVDDSIVLARTGGRAEQVAAGLLARARLERSAGSTERARVDYLAALDEIERLRALQDDGLVRARMLWSWRDAYAELVDLALDGPSREPREERADLALQTMERLRVRTYLDSLGREVRAALTADPAARDHHAVLERLAEARRALWNPALAEPERAALLRELAELERTESERRVALTAISGGAREGLPDTRALRDALAPDEALLLYQLGSSAEDAPKRSWVLALTRRRAVAFPIHSRRDPGGLEERVAVFVGLVERRDDLERPAAVRLYRDLLADVLDSLDPGIRRLIVLPDGVLHRLPFAALRPGPDDPPLAADYEVSRAPSAALWLHWRRSPRTGGTETLSLADPRTDAAQLGARPALPRARKEARALMRHLPRGECRVGEDASESYVKSAALDRFGVLHFAAHAVVDEERPERSAVLLAPGDDGEDGLLRIVEVTRLRLADPVVILSACSSVSGELTAGEGVVGLAQGFFRAGARAVVGGLWPLRDDEAAALVGDLSRELGRGASVGNALAAVRRSRLGRQETAGWAGLVVIGDADATVAAVGRGPAVGRVLLALAAMALATLVFALRRREERDR